MIKFHCVLRAGSAPIFFALPLLFSPITRAATDMDACLLEAIASAGEAVTVGELRRSCETEDGDKTAAVQEEVVASAPVYEQQNLLTTRFAAEAEIEQRPFAITAKRPNYIMHTVMDEANQAPFKLGNGDSEPAQDEEIQFQVSIKAPVWRNMFGSNMDMMVSYTARSYWQLFNDDFSAPFRETNYEPEVYVRDFTDYDVLGVKISGWALGFNHQSNGRTQLLSRSWNRILGQTAISLTDDLALLARAWYRIPEDDEDDDNPGMHRYLGYGDLRAVWAPNRNTFTAMLRPGTEETSYELTWSYPISQVFRIYAQYYNGYGESLLDYDYDMERFGIGITMNDYLQRF